MIYAGSSGGLNSAVSFGISMAERGLPALIGAHSQAEEDEVEHCSLRGAWVLGVVAQTLILSIGTAERCLGCGIVRTHLRGAEVLARMIDTHPKRGGFMAETTALAKGTKPCHDGEEVGRGGRCWDGRSQADPHFSSESPRKPHQG